MTDVDWNFTYPETSDTGNSRSLRRRRGALLNPIAVQRKANGKTYKAGEFVQLSTHKQCDPSVALITEFVSGSKGFMEMKIIYLYTSLDLESQMEKVDSKFEAFFNGEESILSVGRLVDHCNIVSWNKFKDMNVENDKDIYFVKRGYEASTKAFTEEYDFDTLFDVNDLAKYLQKVQEILKPLLAPVIEVEPEVKKRRRAGRPKKSEATGLANQTKPGNGIMDNKPDLAPSKPVGRPRKKENKVPKSRNLSDENEKKNENGNENDDDSFEANGESSEEELSEEFDDDDDDDEEVEQEKVSRRKKSKRVPSTPKKARGRAASVSPFKSPVKDFLRTPTRRIAIKAPRINVALPTRISNTSRVDGDESMPHALARTQLRVAVMPDSLPCREAEFSQIFLALEAAINTKQGSCVYICGTPGIGKTATVREVIAQLQLRNQMGELENFTYLEINGMKLINPQNAYEQLWEAIGGTRVSATNAVSLLETEFKKKETDREPTLVLIDEMDQLVTKSQSVMYNLFNWPTFKQSRLIVVAIANTMDLPERIFSNKITSRLGLFRIQFQGYTHNQLREIIESRLVGQQVVEKDAIEYASRKVASVSGDARRALDICRRAVELAELDGRQTVKIAHIRHAIDETAHEPKYMFLQDLPLASKILLSAVLAQVRRSGVLENLLGDIMEEAHRLCKMAPNADKLLEVLFNNGEQMRMRGFARCVAELVEGGIVSQPKAQGDRFSRIKLMMTEEDVKAAFKNDEEVQGMVH